MDNIYLRKPRKHVDMTDNNSALDKSDPVYKYRERLCYKGTTRTLSLDDLLKIFEIHGVVPVKSVRKIPKYIIEQCVIEIYETRFVHGVLKEGDKITPSTSIVSDEFRINTDFTLVRRRKENLYTRVSKNEAIELCGLYGLYVHRNDDNNNFSNKAIGFIISIIDAVRRL